MGNLRERWEMKVMAGENEEEEEHQEEAMILMIVVLLWVLGFSLAAIVLVERNEGVALNFQRRLIPREKSGG